MPPHQPPAITVKVPDREAAQRQYWRHVANRAALAILADVRVPVLTAAQGSTNPTRGPDAPPRPLVGSDVFRVRAEPIQIELPQETLQTDWLNLEMEVVPGKLGQASQQTLEVMRGWKVQSGEVLFRYDSERQQLRPKPGLSGDVVYLFEMLLWPHAAELLEVMGY